MSPSGPHERINRLLSDFVTAWCDVHGLPNANFGSTTYRRETRRSGLEPDTCFYFEQEPLVRGKEELDLTIDPPPDLAVEVDLRGWSAGRLLVYQELGVAEVWRTNGEWLRVYQWSEDGYVEIPSSRQLPGLLPDALLGFLQRRHEVESGALRAEFRAWAATQSPGT